MTTEAARAEQANNDFLRARRVIDSRMQSEWSAALNGAECSLSKQDRARLDIALGIIAQASAANDLVMKWGGYVVRSEPLASQVVSFMLALDGDIKTMPCGADVVGYLRTIAGGLGVLRGFKIWRHRAHVNKNSAESIMELMTNEGVIEAARKVAGAA